jgi:hypothetical protein
MRLFFTGKDFEHFHLLDKEGNAIPYPGLGNLYSDPAPIAKQLILPD